VTRVAFVGQATFFAACAQHVPAGGIEPAFVDHRGGGDSGTLRRNLDRLDPDVVVVFRPETVAPGTLNGLRATTLGYNTEPLPRTPEPHDDLAFRLTELATTDAGQYDRIITFDPLSARVAATVVPIWRGLPLPVDDRFYAPLGGRAEFAHHPPRIAFVAWSTPYRERFLIDVKHHFDLLHVAGGLHGDQLRTFLDRVDVALNVHGFEYPTFENRVCLHLAAGHLVLSQPLSPTHGLEPDIDFLQFESPGSLIQIIRSLHAQPDLHRAVRLRGRRKAELFRASRVWPRVIRDLQADVAAFGPRARS
jgi:hypothetical protein